MMKRCRALSEFFNKSTQATTELKKSQVTLTTYYYDKIPVGILQDVKTRWWSTWRFLGRLLRLKPAFQMMVMNKTLPAELLPTEDQWNVVDQIENCLRIMAKFQRLLEGEEYVTSSLVVLAVYQIRASYMKTISDPQTSAPVKELSKKLLQDFDERYIPEDDGKVRYTGRADIGHRNRYNGVHPYFFNATMIDPRTKNKLRGMMTEEQYEMLKRDLIEFMVATRKETLNRTLHQIHGQSGSDDQNATTAVNEGEVEDDLFAGLDDITNDSVTSLPVDDVELRIQCESELKLFLLEEGIKLVDPNDKKKYSDCLKWWENNEHRYPAIAPLAKIFLAIPASSAPSERVWSRGSRVLTMKRSNMTQELSSGIMFVKENMDLLNKYYDQVIQGVESALPRNLCGLPEYFSFDAELENMDVGQDLF